MIYIRTIEGTKFKYDSETGELWRWLDGAIRKSRGVPRWKPCGLSGKQRNFLNVFVGSKKQKVQRLVWFIVNGYWPSKLIKHIDHDFHNNRIANLQETTKAVCNKNRARQVNNTSGVNGVKWHKQNSKWQAFINVNYKVTHLGTYESFQDAVAARKLAEAKYGFHPNHGNARRDVG